MLFKLEVQFCICKGSRLWLPSAFMILQGGLVASMITTCQLCYEVHARPAHFYHRPPYPIISISYQVQFYWFDACEDAQAFPGIVYLFGKVPHSEVHALFRQAWSEFCQGLSLASSSTSPYLVCDYSCSRYS